MQGTSQKQRAFTAFNPDYVKIDERGTPFLLSYVRELAAFVKFYDNNNQESGNWQTFFNSELVIWADIAHFDLPKCDKEFHYHLLRMQLFKQPQAKIKHYKGLLYVLRELFGRFDAWLYALDKQGVSGLLDNSRRSEMSLTLESTMQGELDQLRSRISMLENVLKIKGDLTDILQNPGWAYYKKPAPLLSDGTAELEASTEELDEMWIELTAATVASFNLLSDTFKYWSRQAMQYFEQTAGQSNHKPHIALLKSFLSVFEEVKESLNSLRTEHLNYYYRSVLQQRPRPATDDHVFLFFELNPHTKQAIVPEGTHFMASSDDNRKETPYTTEQTAFLSHAKIKHLFAHYIAAGDTLHEVDDQPFWVGGMYACSLDTVLKEQSKQPIAIFGEDQSSKGASERNMQDAALGFAFASPLFTLSEGAREIAISIAFEPESFTKLEAIINAISAKTKTRREELFLKIFLNAFTIRVAVPHGFMTIERYVVTKDSKASLLTFTFELGPDDPPLVAAEATIHERWESRFPLVCFNLNNQAFVYAYNLLAPLKPLQVSIHTKVQGVRNLQVYSQAGRLNASSPFQAFGPLPTVGSYLLIGNNEVTCKPLSSLHINLNWFDLPRHKSGFAGHYEQYTLPIDNTVFEATLSILSSGRWAPEEAPQVFKLFSTETRYTSDAVVTPKGTLVASNTLKNIDIQRIKISPNYNDLLKEPEFTSTSMRGFLKLELAAPYFGFAHDRYPSALAEITIQNSKRSFLKFNSTAAPTPNPPYTPMIQGISLDYEAGATSQIGSDSQEHPCDFYRIFPFGNRKVNEEDALANLSLVPQFNYEGALHIGFEQLNPHQVVNILLQLIDDFTTTSDEEPPELEWHYLLDDQWITLSRKQLIEDTTKSLLETGIITIQTPSDIGHEHQILPTGLQWFRVSAVKNVAEAAKILFTRAQVLKATAALYSETSFEPLPAHSILGATVALPGIQAVLQPFPSFGGKAVEDTVAFNTRVAERLRHKNRAVTVWDYERMILDRFPQIYKVRCLAHTSERRGIKDPSCIMVLLIADPQTALDPYEPMASNSLLYEIKDFLKARTSPFVNLDVRNPTYERVRVFASVKFNYGKNNGLYLQKLNQDVRDYLCSWLPPFHKGAQLGEAVLRSDLLSFINYLPYVDFVTEFSLVKVGVEKTDVYQLTDTADPNSGSYDLMTATHPWCVLTPAAENSFRLIDEEREVMPIRAGVGTLRVAEDFIIGS